MMLKIDGLICVRFLFKRKTQALFWIEIPDFTVKSGYENHVLRKYF